MTSDAFAVTVDGTLLTCKGAIAKLETELAPLPPGTIARVLLNDVPSRIDVRAWADRKGHRVLADAHRGDLFELLIAKDGGRVAPGGPATGFVGR